MPEGGNRSGCAVGAGGMLVALLLALGAGAARADQRGDRVRTEIARFCKGDADCIAYQRRELAAYLRMMAAFRDPGNRNIERCMRAGRVSGQMIDWSRSANCMRAAVRGRRIGE